VQLALEERVNDARIEPRGGGGGRGGGSEDKGSRARQGAEPGKQGSEVHDEVPSGEVGPPASQKAVVLVSVTP
jgi:hypothetical protein